MVARALVAFLALPGMVAFVVPLGWAALTDQPLARAWGLAVAGVGVAGLLWTVRDFLVAGRGTLAPWDPPRRLVVVGLYRYSRNPMYVSVLLILAGWAGGFASWGLALYAAVVAVAFHLRVILGEEPYLAQEFGEGWRDYRAQVPRWLGRRKR